MHRLALWTTLVALLFFSGCGGGNTESAPADSEEPPATQETTSEPDDKAPSASELMARSSAISGLSYEYDVSLGDGTTATQKVWLKGQKMRTEMSTSLGNDNMVVIIDLDDRAAYAYQESQPVILKMPIDELEFDTATPQDYAGHYDAGDMLFLDRESLQGKECLVYEIATGDAHAKLWIWEEYGLPLRIESETAGQKTIVEFKNTSVGNVDDSLFDLPTGMEIMEIGG